MTSFFSKWLGLFADPTQYPATLTADDAAHPLASFFAQRHNPARTMLNNLNSLPSTQTVSFAQRHTIAAQADDLPIGYCRFDDKTGYVHVSATRRNLSADHLSRLASWLGASPLHYKLLYPGFHAHIEPATAASFRCVTSLGADLDGNRAAPLSFTMHLGSLEPLANGSAIPLQIRAKSFCLARGSLLLTPDALHIFLWLGNHLPPFLRGGFSEKVLYDTARYGAHVSAQMVGILPQIYGNTNH